MSRTARGQDKRPGLGQITCDTVDISEWLDFEFYELCWYWDTPHDWDNPISVDDLVFHTELTAYYDTGL